LRSRFRADNRPALRSVLDVDFDAPGRVRFGRSLWQPIGRGIAPRVGPAFSAPLDSRLDGRTGQPSRRRVPVRLAGRNVDFKAFWGKI
jgi:hypothetical protein